jgi:hypothetical protein
MRRQSKLLADENQALRARVATEVAARTAAETQLGSLRIDHKHASAQLADARAECERLQRQSLQLPPSDPYGTLSYGATASASFAGSSSSGGERLAGARAGGFFDALFNPAPAAPVQAAPASGPAAAAVFGLGGVTSYEHMVEARLATDRARDAEKRERALTAQVRELETRLASAATTGMPAHAITLDVRRWFFFCWPFESKL